MYFSVSMLHLESSVNRNHDFDLKCNLIEPLYHLISNKAIVFLNVIYPVANYHLRNKLI